MSLWPVPKNDAEGPLHRNFARTYLTPLDPCRRGFFLTLQPEQPAVRPEDDPAKLTGSLLPARADREPNYPWIADDLAGPRERPGRAGEPSALIENCESLLFPKIEAPDRKDCDSYEHQPFETTPGLWRCCGARHHISSSPRKRLGRGFQ